MGHKTAITLATLCAIVSAVIWFIDGGDGWGAAMCGWIFAALTEREKA